MDDLSIFQNKAPIVYRISNVSPPPNSNFQIKRESHLHSIQDNIQEPIDALEVFSMKNYVFFTSQIIYELFRTQSIL